MFVFLIAVAGGHYHRTISYQGPPMNMSRMYGSGGKAFGFYPTCSSGRLKELHAESHTLVNL